MAVLNISTAVIKDTDLFKDYVEKVAVMLEQQGVAVLCRGRHIATTRGTHDGAHVVAVFRFADRDAVERFYEGAAYQPLRVLRDRACNMTIHLYEE
jgi:uncharacterized protein (DUF1330 family)